MADYTYKFPNGTEVGFRPPSYQDKREALKAYDQKEGYMPEELLAAMCILSINGKAFNEDWDVDYIGRYQDMSLKDQSLYVQMFLQMFQPDDQEKNRTIEEAKKLLAGSTSTPQKKGA